MPLHSQRDEFTGEELYTLRSENYFLDRLDLKDDELAALQTALFYLDGKFAYAEPLRLALQNLALGRPGFPDARTDTAERVRVSAPDYSPELAGRLSKLEAAISKQRTIKFALLVAVRDKVTERTLNPYALRLDEGIWYVVGQDLDRAAIRTFRVSRVRSDIRFATRRERDFRLPPDFDVEAHRVPRPWQIGEPTGTARIAVQGDTAWWVRRTLSDAGTLEDGVFETPFARVEPLAGWVLRQNGRAVPLEPKALRDAVADGLARLRELHEGAGLCPGPRAPRRCSLRSRRPARRPDRARALRRPAGAARAPPHGLRREDATPGSTPTSSPRGSRSRARSSRNTLSLLNLVNFGGGCYTVYAEVNEENGVVRVDKELYGDVFRRAAEAHAARGARDPPRDRLRRPDDRRGCAHAARPGAAQARGDLRPVRRSPQTPAGTAADDEERLVRTLSDAVEKRTVVEIEYLKEGEETPTTRSVEPYTFERELPVWRVHTWDRTADGPRTYRLDRMRSARLTDERFEPRPGFDPNYLSEPRMARLWHSPVVARWKLERGARLLTDKAAVSDLPFKTDEWLLSEVLADAGETVVLEPADARGAIAARATALQRELGLSPRRKRPAARA